MFRISPRLKKLYHKFNLTLFQWATDVFSKWFGGFLKKSSPDFKGIFLYILQHIRLNFGTILFQSVSLLVIGIYNPLLNHLQVLGLLNVRVILDIEWLHLIYTSRMKDIYNGYMLSLLHNVMCISMESMKPCTKVWFKMYYYFS